MDTNDATTETMDIETVGLLTDLMSASQRQLSWTQDQLHISALTSVVKLCDTLVQLGQIIDDATVIDRKTEARLRALDHQIWSAERERDHARRMLQTLTGEDHGADAS